MAYIAGTVLDDTGAAVGGRTVRAYRRDTGALLGSTTSASSAVTMDSSFSSVALLLHGNDSNGSTTIVDSSASARTVTANGATISTAQSKFGGASMYFNGSSHTATIPYSTDFDAGSGDITIEAWVRKDSTADRCIVSARSGANINYHLFAGSVVALDTIPSGGISSIVGTTSFSTNTWHHVAATKSGNTWRIFLDGNLEGSATVSGTYTATSAPLVVGASSSNYFFDGYIDDLRITKGVARYTASFTPPTAAFPDTPIDLATGDYYIQTAYTGEVNVVCLDDSGGTTHNDRILRTTPV